MGRSGGSGLRGNECGVKNGGINSQGRQQKRREEQGKVVKERNGRMDGKLDGWRKGLLGGLADIYLGENIHISG